MMLVIMAGLPGTGKSTVARALAQRLHGHVFDKDGVREAMFGPDRIAYNAEQDDLVIDLMLQAAEHLWRQYPSLVAILDGRVFSRNAQLRTVVDFAGRVGQPWRLIECVCSEETARARLRSAIERRTHVAANRTPALYDQLRAQFQPIPQPKIVVNTDRPLDVEALASLLLRADESGAPERAAFKP